MHGINDEVTILTPNDITAALQALGYAVFLLQVAAKNRAGSFFIIIINMIIITGGIVFSGA